MSRQKNSILINEHVLNHEPVPLIFFTRIFFQFLRVNLTASIVNPVNKLCSLAYKVQQTFFTLAKKHELGEEHDIHACCLRFIIVMETYFILLVKMRNLSRNGSGQGIKLEEGS